MSERHPGGFLQHPRIPIAYRDPHARTRDFEEIYSASWREQDLRAQGARCMDCGVPTCTAGCPNGNLIPDWNDLAQAGRWREALARLHATNTFPEFTGYTCPAPCEPACVLARTGEAVTIKSIERAIVDMGWERGWIVPEPPAARSGKQVAVVGSGPAGLACAQQLNRAGHRVTVFERDEVIGGLMVHGIPDFKFAKWRVARRVEQLRAEGVAFEVGAAVGERVALQDLRRDFDAVCLAIGAQAPREVAIPGRQLEGVHLAMDYLTGANRRQAGRPAGRPIDARGKRVLVLGGGDTGADCVATAHRQAAASVTQVNINVRRPEQRAAGNPWPEWPRTYELTYALAEGGDEAFGLEAAEFIAGSDGRVAALRLQRVAWDYDENGRRTQRHVVDGDVRLEAELVLIAIGFAGADLGGLAVEGIATTPRGAIQVDDLMMTALPGVFAAGDASRGQSLVVWAIGEGRDAARQIDLHLMGHSRLPASLRTANPPLGF
jgi:NAD(P)H-dependent glutamate synthase small subunit